MTRNGMNREGKKQKELNQKWSSENEKIYKKREREWMKKRGKTIRKWMNEEKENETLLVLQHLLLIQLENAHSRNPAPNWVREKEEANNHKENTKKVYSSFGISVKKRFQNNVCKEWLFHSHNRREEEAKIIVKHVWNFWTKKRNAFFPSWIFLSLFFIYFLCFSSASSAFAYLECSTICFPEQKAGTIFVVVDCRKYVQITHFSLVNKTTINETVRTVNDFTYKKVKT